jgi:hypothetical protein
MTRITKKKKMTVKDNNQKTSPPKKEQSDQGCRNQFFHFRKKSKKKSARGLFPVPKTWLKFNRFPFFWFNTFIFSRPIKKRTRWELMRYSRRWKEFFYLV